MIHMTSGFSLALGAVLALGSPASLAVLAAEGASAAAAAAGAEDVAVAADADAAVVNQLLACRFQHHSTNPCMSQCRGLFYTYGTK
jgi:hypothetical protein